MRIETPCVLAQAFCNIQYTTSFGGYTPVQKELGDESASADPDNKPCGRALSIDLSELLLCVKMLSLSQVSLSELEPSFAGHHQHVRVFGRCRHSASPLRYVHRLRIHLSKSGRTRIRTGNAIYSGKLEEPARFGG